MQGASAAAAAPPRPDAADLLDVAAFKARAAEKRRATQEEAAEIRVNVDVACELMGDVAGAKGVKDGGWDSVLVATGLTAEEIRATERGIRRLSMVKVIICLLVVGCELDLFGFVMAFTTYWDLQAEMVRGLLIAGPVGYLIATAMYMFYAKDPGRDRGRGAPQRPVAQRPKEPNPYLTSAQLPSPSLVATPRGDDEARIQLLAQYGLRPGAAAQRESIRLRYFHFLPIFRYYLVIKDLVPDDIEGLFRVNVLSTFTIGFAQIFSMIYLTAAAGETMNVFVKICILSQCVNGLITVIHFCFPSVSAHLKASIKVDALVHNMKNGLREQLEHYNVLVERLSQGGNESAKDELAVFHLLVDTEISELCCAKIDLKQYPMEKKFELRRLLREKMALSYARMK